MGDKTVWVKKTGSTTESHYNKVDARSPQEALERAKIMLETAGQ